VNDKNYDPANPCDLECIVHHELPRARGEGRRRRTRLGQGVHVDDSLLHNDQNISTHRIATCAARATLRPTSSDVDRAAKALYLTIPEVKGCFDGFALRVPTRPFRWSISLRSQESHDKDELNALLKKAADGRSSTCCNTPRKNSSRPTSTQSYSSIVDGKLTNAQGDLIQLALWYDNEWATRAVSPTSRRWS